MTKTKWFWIRGAGFLMTLFPLVIYMTMWASSVEETEFAVSMLQYVAASAFLMLTGYFLMRQGVQEEERERMKTLIREVLAEQREPQVTEASQPSTAVPNRQVKVITLPFMKDKGPL